MQRQHICTPIPTRKIIFFPPRRSKAKFFISPREYFFAYRYIYGCSIYFTFYFNLPLFFVPFVFLSIFHIFLFSRFNNSYVHGIPMSISMHGVRVQVRVIVHVGVRMFIQLDLAACSCSIFMQQEHAAWPEYFAKVGTVITNYIYIDLVIATFREITKAHNSAN